jgi:hypothetical protein
LLDGECLIEIGRAQRIERNELDRCAIDVTGKWLPGGSFRRRFRVLRKGTRQLELRADCRESVTQRPRAIDDRLQDFTIVTCATSIAPPRKPPSQYIR